MTKDEKTHLLAAFKNLEDYENWLYFTRFMLFAGICFVFAWGLQAVLL